MRADNNWEDSVGKRLFDFEGELSPQAWKNINRRISPKPKQRWRWLWLPVLLLFIALPIAFLLKDKTKSELISGEKQVAQTKKNKDFFSSGKQETANPGVSTTTSRVAPSEELPAPAHAENKAGEKPVISGSAIVPDKDNPQLVGSPEDKNVKRKLLPALLRENREKPEHGKKDTIKKRKKIIGLNIALQANDQKNNKGKTAAKSIEKVTTATSPESSAFQDSRTAANGINVTEIAVDDQKKIKAGSEEKADSEAKDRQIKTESKDSNLGKEVKQPEMQNPVADNIYEDQKEIKKPVEQPTADTLAIKVALAAAPQPQTDTTSAPAEIKTETVKKWQFSLYASPQYTFQRVHANVNDEVLVLRMNNQNEIESERLGYEFGFRSHYQVSEKLQLETGFHFARLNQYLDFTTASDQADSSFIQQQNGSVLLKIQHQEENQILLFKYYLGGIYTGANLSLGKQWSLAGGFGANWLLWKNPDEKTIPVETKNFNPYLSTGLRYYRPISSSVMLTMGPTLQYYVRPVQKESAWYGSKPTTFGFSVGLLLKR